MLFRGPSRLRVLDVHSPEGRDHARLHAAAERPVLATTLVLMLRELFVVGAATQVAAAIRGTIRSQLCDEAQECTWSDFKLVAGLVFFVVLPLYMLSGYRGSRVGTGALRPDLREGLVPRALQSLPPIAFVTAMTLTYPSSGLPGAVAVTARAVGRLVQTTIRDVGTQVFTRHSHLRANSLYPGHNLEVRDAHDIPVPRASPLYASYVSDRLLMATGLYTVVAVAGALITPVLAEAMGTVPARGRFHAWYPEEAATALVSTGVEMLDIVVGAFATHWAARRHRLQLQLDNAAPPNHSVLRDILDHASLRTMMTAPLDFAGAVNDVVAYASDNGIPPPEELRFIMPLAQYLARILSGVLLGATEIRGYLAKTGRDALMASPASRSGSPATPASSLVTPTSGRPRPQAIRTRHAVVPVFTPAPVPGRAVRVAVEREAQRAVPDEGDGLGPRPPGAVIPMQRLDMALAAGPRRADRRGAAEEAPHAGQRLRSYRERKGLAQQDTKRPPA
ncbi:hypothetical protein [Ramlibacter rhizophilus]|uniref:Uncharacterized protein n=1 Tax=Ramlibacter rhizophilus TaxID=1781167 RepID=A0A4Z0BY11_9BURK|nr:hypothetical protein [Ramlibacter rhizophilus]TFZ04216.1 hypothetical protein EZ242_00165 [Ramlibacter rhizophilus]